MNRKAAQGIAGHRTALQRIAKQSNAGSSFCGLPESFWLNRTAQHSSEANSNEWQLIASKRNKRQSNAGCPSRGYPESFWLKFKAVQRSGQQGFARQDNALHGREWRSKATRPVCSTADCPSRFGSKAGHRSTSHKTAADSNERQVSEWHRKATRSVHPVN
jgi:hypothetical protein